MGFPFIDAVFFIYEYRATKVITVESYTNSNTTYRYVIDFTTKKSGDAIVQCITREFCVIVQSQFFQDAGTVSADRVDT